MPCCQYTCRENFTKESPAGKARQISWQIEQIVDELPLYLMRIEEFANLLDERLVLGTFKFCFVVGATMVVSSDCVVNAKAKYFS